MHLYYIGVLRHLLAGKSIFNDFYSIRNNPIPPYTLQYVILFLLTSVVGFIAAEKVMVCLILVSTALGFRYLARACGEAGSIVALWIFPIALSWPLFMGFHNFCLSLSFGLWALGLWFRAMPSGHQVHRGAFLATIALICLTHPVPLLFVLGVAGLDNLVALVIRKHESGGSWVGSLLALKHRLRLFAVACCSLLYISLFLNPRAALQVGLPPAPSAANRSCLTVFLDFVHLAYIGINTGTPWSRAFRIIMACLLIACVALAVNAWLHGSSRRKHHARTTMLIAALALLLFVPFLPSRMNGLDFFEERLPMLIWLAALVAVAFGVQLGMRLRFLSAALACVFAVLNLCFADGQVRPFAKQVALLEMAPAIHQQFGLLLPARTANPSTAASYGPYSLWNGARLFRRDNIELLNDPWAGPPNILPVGRRPNPLLADLSQVELMHPELVYRRLMQVPEQRRKILTAAGVVIFMGQPTSSQGALDPLLALDPAISWKCNNFHWYFSCEKVGVLQARAR